MVTNTGANDDFLGSESSLSNWAGDYVTDMLGKGAALGSEPYQAYGGPLTAGASDLQTSAFEGIGGLDIPTENMGAFTPQTFTAQNAADYMNPYLMASLNPQIEEAKRQSDIERLQNATRMTQAGSFGGSRQAILDAENQRNLQSGLANIVGTGYNTAFDTAMGQFNTEQDREMAAKTESNAYGLAAIQKLYDLGADKRGIESEGITADKKQFEEERDFPYKQVQYMQSLLQDLPVSAQEYNYTEPSALNTAAVASSDWMSWYNSLFGDQVDTLDEGETAGSGVQT